MATDNRIFCYRADGSCYAVLSAAQWRTLRNSKQLDAYLAKQRDAGQVVKAKRTTDDGDTATIARRGSDLRALFIPSVTAPRTFDGARGSGVSGNE